MFKPTQFKPTKVLLASASLAALFAATPAQALNVPCPTGFGLDQCYGGTILNLGSSFSDVSIGSLNLGAGSWNLDSFFGGIGLDNLAVSLVGASTLTDFSNVAGGNYAVKLSGSLTTPFTGPTYMGMYGGGFDVKAAVPEPQTYAMMLAGLIGLGCMAKRRKAN
jgi:hypothetical protein